jgi:hypothetical protein
MHLHNSRAAGFRGGSFLFVIVVGLLLEKPTKKKANIQAYKIPHHYRQKLQQQQGDLARKLTV